MNRHQFQVGDRVTITEEAALWNGKVAHVTSINPHAVYDIRIQLGDDAHAWCWFRSSALKLADPELPQATATQPTTVDPSKRRVFVFVNGHRLGLVETDIPLAALGTQESLPEVNLAIAGLGEGGKVENVIHINPYRYRSQYNALKEERLLLDAKQAAMADKLGSAESRIAELERDLRNALRPKSKSAPKETRLVMGADMIERWKR